MKENLNKGKDMSHSWSGRFNMVKSNYSQIDIQINANKNLSVSMIFVENDIEVDSCLDKMKTVLKKRKEKGELIPLGFKTYYKTIVINTVWY